MVTLSRNLLTISALVLFATSRGWAGPGDLDPNFGSAGRLEPGHALTLVLPDDRLVAGDYAGNLIVSRLDANGRVDATFGEGGEMRVPLPDAWPRFEPTSVGATPDGGVVFAGPLRDYEVDTFQEAVLRLDHDGHVVTTFGGHGDGYYRLTDGPANSNGVLPTTLAAIAVDANGRVLLAERTRTADGGCSSPSRLTRLTTTGALDAAFGANGRIDVPEVDLCDGHVLFGVRSDTSIVIGARGVIVGFDTNGTLDPTFGVDGRVSGGLPAEWERAVLLPNGGILIMQLNGSTTANAVLTKLDRGGHVDVTFGAGTGSVQLEFGAAFLGLAGSLESVQEFVLAPDAAHVYVKLSVQQANGTTACAGGIARFSLDGTPDLNFGRQGLTCLDYGAAFPFSLLAVQRNGSPLFGTTYGGVYRLLTDSTASPGMIMVASGRIRGIAEGVGTVTVPVVRTAGRDGAVSVGFATGPGSTRYPCGYSYCITTVATPGSDFEAVAGQLNWADGDDSEREISVKILDDKVDESAREGFRIQLSNPEGALLDLGQSVTVAIADDDAASPPTPTPTPAPTSANGGGGSSSWAAIVLLSGLLLARRRPRRVHPEDYAASDDGIPRGDLRDDHDTASSCVTSRAS